MGKPGSLQQCNIAAGALLPGVIHYFVFRVSGLFSVCSQLWEGKNPKNFPLLSVSCQLFGRFPENERKVSRKLRGVQVLTGGIHRILVKYILAYNSINVKGKMTGAG